MEHWSAQGIINDYLKAKFSVRRKSDYWRGSDFGRCLRMRIYNRQGVSKTETMDTRQMGKMEQGNIIHWYWQKRFEDLGILVEKEMEIKDDKLNYLGHGDAIVDINKIQELKPKADATEWFKNFLKKEKERYKEFDGQNSMLFYEIKSIHSMGFNYLQYNGKPQSHHKKQLISYLTFAKKKYPGLKEGRLLYSSKDDARVMEFPVMLDKKSEEEVYKELELLNFHWKKKTLPPKISIIDLSDEKKPKINWECKFCPFLTYCRGQGGLSEANKKLRSLKIKDKVVEKIEPTNFSN